MTSSFSMKEYQLKLSDKLKQASESNSTATMLGVALGDDRYLVHMSEVNEVIQLPKVTPVSLTQPWFLGLANVRGNLYGITNLGLYLGYEPAPFNLKARILLVSPRYRINSGLLVNSMLGIRSLSDFERVECTDILDKPSIVAQYMDKGGRLWHQMNLQKLVRDERFVQIAI